MFWKKDIIELPLAKPVVDQLKRFPEEHQEGLQLMAESCMKLRDLLHSFPAAAYAIVTEFGDQSDRSKAIRLIKNGQPLRLVAEALGLPYWMRKVPPEALKYNLVPFPDDLQFHRHISGTMPSDIDALANWLIWVPEAARLVDNDFAYWIAKQSMLSNDVGTPDNLLPLALYAWYSGKPESYAGGFIDTKWDKTMAFDGVLHLVRSWLNKIRIEVLAGTKGITNTWLKPGHAHGYDFVPLMTQADLNKEGEVLDHCVASYMNEVVQNNCRIFGIRQGDKHVATLDIRVHEIHEGIPVIEQLSAFDNEEAPPEIWRATFEWLSRQQEYNLPDAGSIPDPDEFIWKCLWSPYWSEKGKVPLLPEGPDRYSLQALENCLNTLTGYV